MHGFWLDAFETVQGIAGDHPSQFDQLGRTVKIKETAQTFRYFHQNVRRIAGNFVLGKRSLHGFEGQVDQFQHARRPDALLNLYRRGFVLLPDRYLFGCGMDFKGYWRNDEATAKTLRPGRYPWERVLHTGDLFRMDEEGFLYFVGRKDDILKSRGEKVSPKEVENVLYGLPGVREAALVGVPDPILGHALKAILVADREDLDARAVIAHCRAQLEDFMVPREVEFRDALPKTGTGKIRRSVLQAEAEGRVMAGEDE